MKKSEKPHSVYETCGFSIPVDFCIEFWNGTFSLVVECTEKIFLTASARIFQWCKPGMRSCFLSKVIQVFLGPTQLRPTLAVVALQLWLNFRFCCWYCFKLQLRSSYCLQFKFPENKAFTGRILRDEADKTRYCEKLKLTGGLDL